MGLYGDFASNLMCLKSLTFAEHLWDFTGQMPTSAAVEQLDSRSF